MNGTTVRHMAIAEATSFLVLLTCMIFKYSGPHAALPVRITGWIHGLLFVLYVAVVVLARRSMKWSVPMMAAGLAAALLPFAPYFVAHHVRAAAAPAPRTVEPEQTR